MFSKNQKINYAEVVKYRLPVYASKSKEKYVYFYVLDPQSVLDGYPRLKRLKKKFGHIKKKKDRDEAALRFCYEISKKLKSGWNPLIQETTAKGYTLLTDVLDRYEKVMRKMVTDDVIKVSTHNNYVSRLRQLKDWCANLPDPIVYAYQLDRHVFENFLEHIYLDRDTSPKTRNNYLNWLGGMCNWMKANGYLKQNPVEDIAKLREHDKRRKAMTSEDMKILSDYLEQHDRHFLLACLILYYTMVRPNEMTYLKIGDFRIKEQTLFVSHSYSKNRKDAVVTVPARVIRLMVELDTFSYPSDYYLFGRDFRPTDRKTEGRIFRERWIKVRDVLGFPDTYQFYSLKDTGISDAIDRVGLTVTKDQARHSNIATTNKYVRKEQMSAHPELKNFEGNL